MLRYLKIVAVGVCVFIGFIFAPLVIVWGITSIIAFLYWDATLYHYIDASFVARVGALIGVVFATLAMNEMRKDELG